MNTYEAPDGYELASLDEHGDGTISVTFRRRKPLEYWVEENPLGRWEVWLRTTWKAAFAEMRDAHEYAIRKNTRSVAERSRDDESDAGAYFAGFASNNDGGAIQE